MMRKAGWVIAGVSLVALSAAAGAALYAWAARAELLPHPAERVGPGPGAALLMVVRTEAVPNPGATTRTDAEVQRAVETHAARLRWSQPDLLMLEPNLESYGVRNTDWFKQFNGDVAAAEAALGRGLTVQAVPGTSLIAVRVTGPGPGDASILANAVCYSFINDLRISDQRQLKKKIHWAVSDQQPVEREREAIRRALPCPSQGATAV